MLYIKQLLYNYHIILLPRFHFNQETTTEDRYNEIKNIMKQQNQNDQQFSHMISSISVHNAMLNDILTLEQKQQYGSYHESLSSNKIAHKAYFTEEELNNSQYEQNQSRYIGNSHLQLQNPEQSTSAIQQHTDIFQSPLSNYRNIDMKIIIEDMQLQNELIKELRDSIKQSNSEKNLLYQQLQEANSQILSLQDRNKELQSQNENINIVNEQEQNKQDNQEHITQEPVKNDNNENQYVIEQRKHLTEKISDELYGIKEIMDILRDQLMQKLEVSRQFIDFINESFTPLFTQLNTQHIIQNELLAQNDTLRKSASTNGEYKEKYDLLQQNWNDLLAEERLYKLRQTQINESQMKVIVKQKQKITILIVLLFSLITANVYSSFSEFWTIQ